MISTYWRLRHHNGRWRITCVESPDELEPLGVQHSVRVRTRKAKGPANVPWDTVPRGDVRATEAEAVVEQDLRNTRLMRGRLAGR